MNLGDLIVEGDAHFAHLIDRDRNTAACRQIHHPLGRHTDCDNGADAGLALQVEGAAMQFDQPLGQRQTKAGTLLPPAVGAVDLLEGGQCLRNFFGSDANPVSATWNT